MGAVTFDKLYDNYNMLSEAKDKASEHTKEYVEAIAGTKGDEKEKKLAAQIISKFFKYFPSLQSQAIEAIFDICEDDDTSIRIAAMKTLPSFCKENKEYVSKVADILAQLLQLDDPQEYNVACNSLLQVLKEDPLASIKCIFKHIHESDPIIRERCIKFFIVKIKLLDKNIITPEIEDVIIIEIKKAIQSATAEEYIHLMPYLASSKLANTLTGQQELLDITSEQLELDQEFDPLEKDTNNTTKLISCIKYVLPIFSSKLESTKFVCYICEQVLPQWTAIASLEQGETLQLVVLRQLAELSIHCGKLENASLHVVQIFEKLKMYMPPPPEEETSTNVVPPFEFSCVESLLFAFHRLARQCPDFLTNDPQVLKDFRSRLMYFSQGVQGCLKAMNANKGKVLSLEVQKQQKVAPRLLNNINTLIKDLFYQPPVYKCNVTLSFKGDEEKLTKEPPSPTNGSNKRHVPITFESNGASNKQPRTRSGDNVKIYTPPSGKFSNNFNNDRKGGGRFNRGGRRGRSSSRGWRN